MPSVPESTIATDRPLPVKASSTPSSSTSKAPSCTGLARVASWLLVPSKAIFSSDQSRRVTSSISASCRTCAGVPLAVTIPTSSRETPGFRPARATARLAAIRSPSAWTMTLIRAPAAALRSRLARVGWTTGPGDSGATCGATTAGTSSRVTGPAPAALAPVIWVRTGTEMTEAHRTVVAVAARSSILGARLTM